MAGIKFDMTLDNDNFIKKLREAEVGVNDASKKIEQSGMSIEQVFDRIKNAAALSLAGLSAKEFITSVAQVRGEFQQLEVAFNTMLGSKERADELMQQLIKTAATTPFDLQGVANGAKQLLAYGEDVNKVNDDLIRLGNIAAGLSQPLGDIVYLYGTTMTQGRLYTQDLNQFTGRGIPMIRELAKQFGVAENEVKGLVEAGKVGFPEVQKVIMSLTDEGGMFFNLMEEQSKTITGRISNIEDAFSTMLNGIGKANEGVIYDALEGVSYLIENYDKVGREILALVSAYGAYKAVLVSVAAYQKAVTGITYATEMAELSKLIPAKKQSANADLEQAVASGRLSQAKYEEISAMRASIAVHMQELEVIRQKSIASLTEANRAVSANARKIASAKAELALAYQSGNAKKAELITMQLHTLETEKSALATQRLAAQEAYETAVKTKESYATAVDTANKNINTLATNRLAAAKSRLIAVSKALGLSMLANPYVLAAAAVAGLAYGIYKLSTAETVAEKATRKHREEQEKFQKTIDERRSKIDELLRIIQDETETEFNQIKAYEQLKTLSPALTDAYSKEQLATASLAETNKKLNEERDKQNYKEIVRNIEKYRSSIEMLGKQMQTAGQGAPLIASQIISAQESLKKWEEDLANYNKLKKQADEDAKPVEVKLLEAKSSRDQILQEFLAAKKTLEEEQEKLKNSPFAVIPIDVQIRFNNAQVALKDADERISELESQKGGDGETYKEAYKEAQDNWKAKIKALKDAKNGTKAEYTKAKKELDDAEKAYKDLGGDTTGKSVKSSNKQAEQQQRLYDELLAIRRKNQQDEISLMEEGTDKKLAQIKADYEAQKQEIEKQARVLAKANKEAGITEVNANGLTYGQQNDINSSLDINIRKMNKSINDLYKSSIDEYQSYTDQRIAIEKKFNDDIALLQEARKRAEEQGNANEILKIDRSIAKATSERGKELMRHDLDVLKQSPEYIRAFEDLKNTSSETLNSLLNQLENAKQIAAQTLNPEDLREYTTTIQEIMDELDSRNPFKALADRQRELAEAEKVLAEAKKQLDSVNKGAKIVTGRNIGDDGKIKLTYLSAADAINKYKDAKDKHQKANNKFIKAEKDAIDKVDELSNAIKELGGAIGGQAGEIISIMGDVALFATTTINGIGKVSQAGANAISAVEKASVILGIISTAIQLLQKISELGNNKAFKQYEAYAEKVKEINALTDAVNEYRIASLEARQAEESWFSEDNLKTLRDYKKIHDEVYQAYVDKAGEAQAVYQNQSGGGWLTGAFNWVMGNLSALSWWDEWKNIWGQGDYGKGTTAAINNLRIETRKKSSGFLGTGIGGKSQKTEDLVSWARKNGLGELFDDEGLINKELAQSLIDNYGDKLVGQTKETLEALIALREQYDEYINQLHEYVSSLYEPLVDNFVDSLWDWFDNGKDALDSFKEYASDTFRDIVSDMMRTIVLDKIVGSFSDDIAALYEEYAKGAIDETKLMEKVSERTSGLIDNYEENLPILQGIMNQVTGYLQGAGIDLKQPESMSQQASGKGFEAMSQDTGEELNGRFTALQVAGEEIKNQMINAVIGLNSLLSVSTDGNAILNNILIQHMVSNSYLEDIAKYTKPILEFGAKFDKIVEQTK